MVIDIINGLTVAISNVSCYADVLIIENGI